MTPQNKQYLMYGGLALLLVGGYYAFFSTPTETGTGAGNGIDPTGNSATNTGDGNTFSAIKIATDLYDAMKNSGTDSKAIVSVLTYVNASQFAAVVKAFGSLAYNDILGNQYQINPFSDLPKVDLKGWLFSELSDADYRILKLKYPNNL